LDFTISAGHHFDMTIEQFNPLIFNVLHASAPSALVLESGANFVLHDLLEFEWDASTGVTNGAQANAAVTTDWGAHDAKLTFHSASGAELGTITFVGLANGLHAGDTFGWINHFPTVG
jgi:hypothetical protein